MKKTSKAYKTIGEVAEILELGSIGKKKTLIQFVIGRRSLNKLNH